VQGDVEFHSEKWKIMNLNEIKERYKQNLKKEQRRVVPFAYTYLGMGHIHVMAFNPVENHVFLYVDGGANDWDRRDNHNRMLSMTSVETEAQRCSLSILWDDQTKISI
jgi:hypothetical protein